nr:hypothetical protein BaRGS_015963 [Batillaria attramentaria]
MLGFILIEVGYDATNSFARSWLRKTNNDYNSNNNHHQCVTHTDSTSSSDNAIPQYEDLSDNSKKSNSGQIESVRDEDFRVSSERRPILPELSSRKNNKTHGTGATYMFTMLSSDYVGKAIYGGNPRANAAWPASVCCLYLMADLFQRLCHSVPGYKVEFVCMQLVLAGLFVSLALTARLEAFFVLSAAAGAHRAIICSVPYAAANDVMQAEAERAKNSGSPRVGLAMAVVTGMMPLAYLTLFPWVGHLETLTGVVSLSPWLGAGFACLAAVFFMPAVI